MNLAVCNANTSHHTTHDYTCVTHDCHSAYCSGTSLKEKSIISLSTILLYTKTLGTNGNIASLLWYIGPQVCA